ncbi:hypothetical protein D4764_01G0020550 [Takifugu flavidus]|uniref:Uncharacterized protein n=1 Tax=Takifugu flavidus TaxID=433684 RepID=A0A5C6PUE8_9TELE|nr:hypothetical protein D4764_01G0020550 [Takifugu flavidus]
MKDIGESKDQQLTVTDDNEDSNFLPEVLAESVWTEVVGRGSGKALLAVQVGSGTTALGGGALAANMPVSFLIRCHVALRIRPVSDAEQEEGATIAAHRLDEQSPLETNMSGEFFSLPTVKNITHHHGDGGASYVDYGAIKRASPPGVGFDGTEAETGRRANGW